MRQRRAPAIATWLLKHFCSGAEYESATGDLLEQYQAGRGDLWYCRQVFDLVRRSFVRVKREQMGQELRLVLLLAFWLSWSSFLVLSRWEPVLVSFAIALVWFRIGGLVLYWFKRFPVKL